MTQRRRGITSSEVIPCDRTATFEQQIATYARELEQDASQVGSHGLSRADFERSGLFRAAVERLRGQFAASTTEKYAFICSILAHLQDLGSIASFTASGGANRHDFEVVMPSGRIVAIEAKGCLDGNNTNIFSRPQNAEEFIIWSYCQNPGASPRHNVWSGIHVRLSAEIITRQADAHVDGLIVWDALCGTPARPCPKLAAKPARAINVDGVTLPPPCIYLFPATVPHPGNNPAPRTHELREVHFLEALQRAFGGDDAELTEVHMACRYQGAYIERQTKLVRDGDTVVESDYTAIRRT